MREARSPREEGEIAGLDPGTYTSVRLRRGMVAEGDE
jgi:hypothetical protein